MCYCCSHHNQGNTNKGEHLIGDLLTELVCYHSGGSRHTWWWNRCIEVCILISRRQPQRETYTKRPWNAKGLWSYTAYHCQWPLSSRTRSHLCNKATPPSWYFPSITAPWWMNIKKYDFMGGPFLFKSQHIPMIIMSWILILLVQRE